MRYKFEIMDGAGRAYKKASDHPDGASSKYAGQITVFDKVGQTEDSSNVLAIDGNWIPTSEDSGKSFLYTHLTRDELARLKLVTLPDNNTREMEYTGCGCAGSNETKVTDELGHYTETKNDARGRLIEATEPNPSSAQNIYSRATYVYDDLDRLIQINHTAHPGLGPNNSTQTQIRTFSYDGYGRMVSETTPEGGTVNYTYTTNDQVFQVSNQRNITVATSYNTRGLPTNISYSDGTPQVVYNYDAYGARTSVTDGEGQTSYSYNSYRQLQNEVRTFTGLPGNSYTLNYTYNQGDQVKSVNYLAPGFNKTINYAYNPVGALGSIGTNLIGTDASNTTNVLNTVSFRASGALKSLNYGNGRRLTMGYNDQRSQPTSMVVDRVNNSADRVVDYTYDYYTTDPDTGQSVNNNRIRKITDNIDTAYTTSYLYDNYNRLTNATANAFSRSYSYDEWGNIRNFAGLTLNYATNSTGAPTTNRLSTDSASNSYTYDAAGNMTAGAGQSYSYDGANRLKTASGGTSDYGYDGDGKRVKKTEGGTTVYYVSSTVMAQTAMEITSTGIQRAYVYSGNKMVAMLATDGQFYWFHSNHLNNSRAMTDANGNLTYKGQFDPYGAALTEWSSTGNANLNNKKFTGYERDNSGLDYAQARMYSSVRGRFMSPDPAGHKAADMKKPMSLNRYAYVEGDPVNSFDPTGQFLANPSDPCVSYYFDGVYWFSTCGNAVLGGIFNDIYSGGGSGSQVKSIHYMLPLDNPHNLLDSYLARNTGCKNFLNSVKGALGSRSLDQVWDTIDHIGLGLLPPGVGGQTQINEEGGDGYYGLRSLCLRDPDWRNHNIHSWCSVLRYSWRVAEGSRI